MEVRRRISSPNVHNSRRKPRGAEKGKVCLDFCEYGSTEGTHDKPPEHRNTLSRQTGMHAKKLGYCRLDDRGKSLNHLQEAETSPEPQRKSFEAACPSINLTGKTIGRESFDCSVAEAYWIGKELLTRVPTPASIASLTPHFRTGDTWM